VLKLPDITKTLTRGLTIAFILVFGNTAFAQQHSSQSIISISVGEGVKISNVDDWFLGTYAANHNMGRPPRLLDQQCVFSSTGTFSLAIAGQNSTNQLRMMNAAGDSIRYRTQMTFFRGNTQRRANFARPRTVRNISGASTIDCSDSPNTGWNIQFSTWVYRGSFNSAPPGTYQDTVSITVIPE
jgi:spore coat protein U-like protein